MRVTSLPTLFCAALLAASQALAADFRRELTGDEREDVAEFVLNNALHVGFHEAGHMLVSELKIPVLGREEDAADNLASIIMLESDDEDLSLAIEDAADGWFLLDENSEDLTDDDLLDTHSLDSQRAYNVVCMMTGADPDYFEEFADDIDFPDDRREECVDEYAQTRDSWLSLLEPHRPAEGAHAAIFKISYAKPKKGYETYAQILKDGEFLETVSETVGEMVGLRDGIRLTAKNCGEPDAYWDPDDREVTFCYEMSELHAEIITDYFLEDPDE
ncbi:MAG: DUF4344 domain-containing metallopeptidase [Oricola sp.]